VVAFHFLQSNQAAWKCDACRKSGLEQRRGCGKIGTGEKPSGVVWARKGVTLSTCPTSYITGESIALLEEYGVWKVFGHADYRRLPARLADAICLLERELTGEKNHVENRVG
jgi:hypothetical protein